VYAHLFAQAEDHAVAAREALETSYAAFNGDVAPRSAGVSWNQ
jgi:hypothetical protein